MKMPRVPPPDWSADRPADVALQGPLGQQPELWTDPAAIDPALRAEIDRHLDPAQLVALAAGLALFVGFAKIAVVLGAMPDQLPVMVVPTPA